MTDAYTKAGVNVSLGDRFSKICRKLAEDTWDCNPYVKVVDFAAHNFRGPRGYQLVSVPRKFIHDLGSDGVGTKVSIITAAGFHRTAGYDLVAMTCMDRTRWGGLPIVSTNVLDVAALGKDEDDPIFKAYVQAVAGMCEASKQIGVVVFGGETAELGVHVGSENPVALTKFNWSGAVHGLIDPERVVTGKDIQAGDSVIALRERGFRSNGLSAVRKAFAQCYGTEWWQNPDAQRSIQAAAASSVLYDKFLATMNGWYNTNFEPVIDMKCISHISGGGIPSKFFEDVLVPLGFSAVLENLYDPSEIMRDCAEWYQPEGKRMSGYDCYKTWNGGQGALVVVRPQSVKDFINEAHNFGIEAKECGFIVKHDEPCLIISSKFRLETLEF